MNKRSNNANFRICIALLILGVKRLLKSKTTTNFLLQVEKQEAVKKSWRALQELHSGWTRNKTPAVDHQWELYSFHSSKASYSDASPLWELKKQSCLNPLTPKPMFQQGRQPSWKISAFCPLLVQENRITLWIFMGVFNDSFV